MAAQYYSSASLKVIDERYFAKVKTADIINKGIRLEFNGKNSVTIYNVGTVQETDYIRSGANRFGQLVELGTGTQTFTLSQDKAATWSIDRGSYNDSMMVTEAASSVKRQLREVSLPNVDKYRLATLQAYAVANSQSQVTVITTSNAYATFIAQTAILVDLLVEGSNLVAFMTQTTYNLLRQDPAFKVASSEAYKDVKTGVINEVDGVKIKVVPASYLPANTNYLIVADDVLVAPTKMDMVRTLDEVQGIDGWVVEMRRYYDAFIPTNRGKALRAVMAA